MKDRKKERKKKLNKKIKKKKHSNRLDTLLCRFGTQRELNRKRKSERGRVIPRERREET